MTTYKYFEYFTGLIRRAHFGNSSRAYFEMWKFKKTPFKSPENKDFPIDVLYVPIYCNIQYVCTMKLQYKQHKTRPPLFLKNLPETQLHRHFALLRQSHNCDSGKKLVLNVLFTQQEQARFSSFAVEFLHANDAFTTSICYGQALQNTRFFKSQATILNLFQVQCSKSIRRGKMLCPVI